MDNGKPRFVTAMAHTDVADDWRNHRWMSGCAGLAAQFLSCDRCRDERNRRTQPVHCCPRNSPRLYRDKLWLHNSGTGEFGVVEIDSGRFEPFAFAPGGF